MAYLFSHKFIIMPLSSMPKMANVSLTPYAELDVNNGDCTLCQDDEEFNSRDGKSGLSGYPLTNSPDTINCDFVNEVAPLVRYINTCDTFHKWYGTGVCCFQAFVSEAPTPASAPTSSANQVIVKGSFVFVVGFTSSLLFRN